MKDISPRPDGIVNINDPKVRENDHLAFLAALPPVGIGGEVMAALTGLPQREPQTNYPLEFVGNGLTVRLVTDVMGVGQRTGVPQGTYKLISPPPPGYRFECDGNTCNALRVHDRALSTFSITLVPLAVLKIAIHDTKGRRVSLRAEFNVYEASSGRLVGPFSNDLSYLFINAEPFAAIEKIVPGEYVLGLVLTKIVIGENGFSEFIDQTIIFDRDAHSIDRARRISVKPGVNTLKFTLPASIKLVRTLVKISGGGKADLSKELELITASDTRPHTTIAKYYFYRPKGHPDEDAFWSLPGQTWSIGVFGYDMEGAKYGKITISPEKDGVLRLKLTDSVWQKHSR